MGVVGIQLRRYLLRLSGCERNPGGGLNISTPGPLTVRPYTSLR